MKWHGISWHQLCPGGPQKAFVLMVCNGFQERASIFAPNRGTKDVEGHCGLTKEELILLARRGSSAGRALGVLPIVEQL